MKTDRDTVEKLKRERDEARRQRRALEKRLAQTERELADVTGNLQTLVDKLPYGYVQVDTKGTVTLANKKLAEILDVASKDDMVGMSFRQFLRSEDRKRAAAELTKAVALRDVGLRHYRIRTAAGTPKTLAAKGLPLREHGKLKGFQATVEDVSDRLDTEKTLAWTEQRYQTLVENLEDVIYATDLDGKITFMSPAVERFGFKPKEVIGRDFLAFVAPEERAAARRHYQTSIREGRQPYSVRRVIDRWGKTRIIENASMPLQDRAGKTIGVTGIIRDITEQHEAEQAVRRKEERFRQVADLIPHSIFEADVDGRIRFLSRSGLENTGRSPVEVKGMSNTEFVIPADRKRVRKDMRAILRGTPLRGKHYTAQRKDGSTYPILLYADRVMEDGEATGVRGAVVDISNLAKAEAAWHESENRYRVIFENTPISLWEDDLSGVKTEIDRLFKAGIKDIEAHLAAHPEAMAACAAGLRVIDVNGETVRLYEAKSKQDLLENLNAILVEESAATYRANFAALADGETLLESETVTQTLTGRRIHIFLRTQIVPGHEQTWDRVLVSVVDVTARKQAEDALQKATEELIQAEKMAMIGKMASGISHEINQPLTAMSAYTGNTLVFLEQGRLADVRSNLMLTRELLTRATEITKQLKMLASGTPDKLRPVSLKKVVNNTLSFMAATARSHKIQIDRQVPRQDPLVLGSMLRLEQVLMNLLNNAFDAVKGRRTRRIAVRLARENRSATLTVHDSGRGIHKRDIDAVFDPFFTTKKGDQGMGLGLSVSLGIIKEYGGTITAANHPDGGALFRIQIPLADTNG